MAKKREPYKMSKEKEMEFYYPAIIFFTLAFVLMAFLLLLYVLDRMLNG